MADQLDDGFYSRSVNAVAEKPFGVVELRRYAMRPGCRDTLIEIFEREFIETQEAVGMVPFGHFRDTGDPDSFVWFRGFETMEARGVALHSFYTSEVWMRNRDAANATMLDSDNVLLLRDARPGSGFHVSSLQRPPSDAPSSPVNRVALSIAAFQQPVTEEFLRDFESRTLKELAPIARPVAYYVNEERPNNYPRLPVRTGPVFVVAGVCATASQVAAWRRIFSAELWETSVLEPASRSLLR